MSNFTREDLEHQAKMAVCSCWYYDLADSIDAINDEELWKFIDIPMYGHLQNQIENKVSAHEFIEEITECYEINYKPELDKAEEEKREEQFYNFMGTTKAEMQAGLDKLTIRKEQ
jgi:hypothetical protein